MKSCKGEVTSKFTVSSPLGPHTFLHRINFSSVKIRPVLKNSYLFHKVENVKS